VALVGGVVVAVEGAVLQALRGGVPRVRRAGIAPWSRRRPDSRVAPMPFEGRVAGEVQRKYGEYVAQWS